MSPKIFPPMKASLACVLWIASTFPALAKDPPPDDGPPALTIERAVAMALENNPALRASREEIDAAAGRAKQAGLWPNPELAVRAEDWPVSGGSGISDSKDTAGIAQTIPFFGKKRLESRIGGAGVDISASEMMSGRAELVRDVRIAFCRVLAAANAVEIARDLVELAGASESATRKRVEGGESADQEQLRAEILLEQVRAELRSFEDERAAAGQTLAQYLGRMDLAEAPVSGTLAGEADFSPVRAGSEKWIPTHPDMLAAKSELGRAELELQRARLEPYPDVTVDVGGGRLGDFDQPIIQMGVSLPLPVIDRAQGKIQEARAKIRAAAARQQSVEQRLLREWGTACHRLRTAHGQAAMYRSRILPKADDALRLVRSGFDGGKFGFNDLLDTQRTAAEVRLAYQQKLLELNTAQAEVEALAAPQTGISRDGKPESTNKKTTNK